MRHPPLVCAAAALLLLGSVQAQTGHYITTVSNAGTTGRMYDVDPSTRTATEFQLPTGISSDPCNTVTMMTSTVGFVGTIGTAATATTKGVPSDLYQINVDWNNHKIAEKKLNTSPLGGYNLAQIVRLGALLYFVTSDFSLSGTAGNTEGILYSMPLSGGSATQLLKVQSVTGWVTGRSANALATDGKFLYIVAWYSGEIIRYDIANKTASLWTTLPASKFSSYPYPVSAHVDGNNLVVAGLFGDVFFAGLSTKVVTQLSAPTADGASYWSPYKNSLFKNTDTGDWVLGSRDATIDPVVSAGSPAVASMARRTTILIKPPYSTTNAPDAYSVNGLWYFPSGSNTTHYRTYGAGCSHTTAGDFIPASGGGIVAAGSTSFSFLVDGLPPKSIGVLILGASQLSLPIGSCTLRVSPLVVIPVPGLASDTNRADQNGTWRATVGPLVLPNLNLKLYSQWGVAYVDAQAALHLIFSDARTLMIQ